MTIWDSIILGIVEGLTEFLPVSSTGHLTIVSKMLGLKIDDPSITGFTAVIQIGAIAAVVLYFWKDIRRIAIAWVRGLAKPEYRGEFDHRMGWYVIVGSLPIVIVGFLARDLISGPLRSLWWVAGALIGWSFFMVAAERLGSKARPLTRITLVDAIVMGVVQCLALIPGVSRSGATISAGLFRGLDRVAATRIAFLLGIPALVGAGIYELKDALNGDVGVVPLLVGTVVSFVVAYASVAWLLRFVAKHSTEVFAFYRVLLGIVLVILLATSTITAT
ncbi:MULTISPECIES: undecaprenyl-diphosphate phosphatase [Kribbella]|jgi:undecaprenyl-diphosphatase|uniref:Undecaprenyl-diphosphatase n=1 Tax=Kribbella pratensis TaxID=2512112 RepID=A0ABY2FIH7_9ACTN|nr:MULTISPECIES: undecaprenyl-diphosphate phosphatase [Kribbella]TDW92140.1 undecaprenyl-diphosphatase [Kribbella sp. VKM Ac-2566]TDW92916.1 undecaprenyl-diphosphatase [Kribbella pratensis]